MDEQQSDVHVLPPLPFGEQQAVCFDDPALFMATISQSVQGLRVSNPRRRARGFASKSCVLQLPQLKLVASVDVPLCLDVNASEDTHLLLPFPALNARSERHGVWLPQCATGREPDVRGMVIIGLEAERLRATAAALFGVDLDAAAALVINAPRSLPLLVGGMDFGGVFRALFQLIDAYDCAVAPLAAINLDDLVYRQVAMMLRPDAFNELSGTQDPSFKEQLIDDLCEKLRARLHLPISLTEIEALSGISARSLQYAFRARFDCTPMAWVREQRLLLARDRLLRGTDSSVMGVAVSCGFGSVSLFSRYYQSRFGETPSTCLKAPR